MAIMGSRLNSLRCVYIYIFNIICSVKKGFPRLHLKRENEPSPHPDLPKKKKKRKEAYRGMKQTESSNGMAFAVLIMRIKSIKDIFQSQEFNTEIYQMRKNVLCGGCLNKDQKEEKKKKEGLYGKKNKNFNLKSDL